jgi:DNA-binding NarL/FixJ family response regulator
VLLADELAHGSLRWQARWWLGQAHLAQRQAGPAADQAREALDRLDALAAELTDATLRSALLNAPLARQVREAVASLAAPVPAATRDYPAGLSEREVEVLRLVAQGATNQEIADTLSISVKTVNAHMTNILNKTACANRAAATSFAMRHGLV